MKRIFYCFIFLLILIVNSTPLMLSAQVIIEDPVVDIQTEWSNHKIDSFHYSTHGTFAFINDGSIWRINPSDVNWIAENQENLIHIAVTIMPEAGTEDYPVRIIVHNDTSYGWKDFTVSQESAPTQPERALISEINVDSEGEPTINIQKQTKEGTLVSTLFINPVDIDTVTHWSAGQRIVVGGVWFPEYDPVGRKEYDCTFLFTIYNYETKDFAFFSF